MSDTEPNQVPLGAATTPIPAESGFREEENARTKYSLDLASLSVRVNPGLPSWDHARKTPEYRKTRMAHPKLRPA